MSFRNRLRASRRCARPRSTVLHSARGDDARQDVVGEDPLGAFVVAVDREGDALVEEGAVGGLLALAPLGGRQLEQPVEEQAVAVPGRVPRREHLVEGGVELVVGEERRRGLGGRWPQHALVGLRRARPVKGSERRNCRNRRIVSHESYQTGARRRSRALCSTRMAPWRSSFDDDVTRTWSPWIDALDLLHALVLQVLHDRLGGLGGDP